MATALDFDQLLLQSHSLIVAQRRELAELFGFESRNKFEIRAETGESIGFAAEQDKSWLGMLARQFLGHWRRFNILIFDTAGELLYVAHHPFRIWFQRMELADAADQPLGALQQRFSIFSKRFDVQDAAGRVVMSVSSPLWRPWTFAFERDGERVAAVRKRWSGGLKEMFTDADNFRVDFESDALGVTDRKLLLAAALFIDLLYFEKKAD